MPVIKINGVALFYELSGPSHAPVVMFSNSLGTTHRMWDHVVPHLRGRYRTLCYDTRGHGGSQVLDQPTTLDDLADDAIGLLDALQLDQVHFAGLSLGGMTGQNLAARYPERLHSLALMATAANMPPKSAWEERIKLVRAEGTAAIVDANMGRWFTPDFVAAGSDALKAVRATFGTIDRAGYAVCCGVIANMDLLPLLPKITSPTLIMAGRLDPATPVAKAEEICGAIRHAELVVLADAAHLLAVEQPEATASYLLGFIGRHDAGAKRGPLGAVAQAAGLANRKAVLGEAHVERSMAKAGPFAQVWQDFITRNAWGEIWGDTRLPWKTRSIVVLAMMVALHREEEFKLHLRPAMANGLSLDELQALLLQTAIYGGVPAANAAFRWAKEVLGDAAS